MSVFCHLPRTASKKSVYQEGVTVTHVSADSIDELCSYGAQHRLPLCGVKKFQQRSACSLWVAVHVELAGEHMRRTINDVSVEKLSSEQYLRRLNSVNHVLPERIRNVFSKQEQMALPITAPEGQVHKDE